MQYRRVAKKDNRENRTILFVEDNRDVSEIVKTMVSLATPYETLHVVDSVEALRILACMKPDLLLLDYHLPTMSGIQLYDIVHAQDEYTHIPAIIITADTSREIRFEIEKRQLMLIYKPFKMGEFVNTLETILS